MTNTPGEFFKDAKEANDWLAFDGDPEREQYAHTYPEQYAEWETWKYLNDLELESEAELETSLQAAADLHRGTQEAQRAAQAKVRALKRTFKGIYPAPTIRTLALIGLMRVKALQDAEIERQKAAQ